MRHHAQSSKKKDPETLIELLFELRYLFFNSFRSFLMTDEEVFIFTA